MADLNQTTLSVEENGETYVFRIPRMRDEARASAFVQNLILQDTGNTQITEGMLDNMAQLQFRTLALFALQLVKTSNVKIYKEDAQTKQPVVDIDAIDTSFGNIYVKYIEELNKFFRPEPAAEQPGVSAPVASEPDTRG